MYEVDVKNEDALFFLKLRCGNELILAAQLMKTAMIREYNERG